MYYVRVTQPAKDDIRQILFWWGENRSQEQAARWYLGILEAIDRLSATADRQPAATEPVLRNAGFKQATFGLGRKPTHRILFGIENHTVIVYRVRAFTQNAIGIKDLIE